MKIYAYVDGQPKFNIDITVPYEKLKNNGREYLGLKGSQELLAVYKQVEDQLKLLYSPDDKVPPLDQLNLDEINLNEYLIQKFPQLQQLELRADEDSYSSSVKNLFGKQLGYPLVWLNCNKYNHYVTSDEPKHQWERCIFGAKLNSLDKIGSLTKHFKKTDEATFYQGDYNAWLGSVKNSFTDNLLLETRKATYVAGEIANMHDFQHDKQFAVYESADKQQITYITSDIDAALKDGLELLDGSKTVKILFPIEVSNGKYAHVIMGSITLSKPDDIAQCNITIYDALASDPFAKQEEIELTQIQQQVAKIFTEKEAEVTFSTGIYNMKYQLPLQTHCGRFVMTWMAAEAAGLNIKKLSNYNEPFNYIFGQIAKNVMSFDSPHKRVAPAQALDEFKEDLLGFFQQRKIEFSKQWTSKGIEDLDMSTALLALIDNVEKNGNIETSKLLIKQIEELSPSVVNVALKNIIDNGMINLGYGSLNSFLTQAKSADFKFSPRTSVALQYQKLAERAEKMKIDIIDEFDEFDDQEEVHEKDNDLDDEFEILDIDDKHLASDILPSKELEAQVKLAQKADNEEDLTKESQAELENPNPTKILSQ